MNKLPDIVNIPLSKEEIKPSFELDLQLCKYDDLIQGWESRQVREAVKDAWVPFLSGLADWRNFWTLTFRDDKSPDVARSLFRWLVKCLNHDLGGKNYINKWGHSYFSYVVGMERQSRDVVHFHVLADQPVNFSKIHGIWGDRCGFAFIDSNIRNQDDVTEYVCKYVSKGGELDLFKRKKQFFDPANPPYWWKPSPSSGGQMVLDLPAGPVKTPSESGAKRTDLRGLAKQLHQGGLRPGGTAEVLTEGPRE